MNIVIAGLAAVMIALKLGGSIDAPWPVALLPVWYLAGATVAQVVRGTFARRTMNEFISRNKF